MSSRVKDLGVRTPYDKVGDLFYFGRMLDKIRSHAKGELPLEYQVNLGKGFDKKCVTFLRVRYELVVEYVNYGLGDEAILESCFGMGRRPSEGEIHMWNEFMRKRGWNKSRTGLVAAWVVAIVIITLGAVIYYQIDQANKAEAALRKELDKSDRMIKALKP